MTQEQLTAFIAVAKGNFSLQEKLKADAVAASAKQAGFKISAEDLKNAQPTELSDEELAHVAGGVGEVLVLSWVGLCTQGIGCVRDN